MPTLERFSPEALRSTVITFRDTLKLHAPGINRLNVYPVPDGDTGTNMASTLDAVVAELDLAGAGLEPTCNAISHGSLMGARGNSGVILSQILRGLVGTLKDATDLTATKVAEALKAASAAAYLAVLKPIEGTILTVVRESADAAAAAAAAGVSLVGMLHAARAAGQKALDNTPELLAVLKDAGVVDAGGAGFLLLPDAALFVVDGEPLPQPDEGDGPSAEQLTLVARRHARDGGVDVSEQRYEVMYFVELIDDRIQTLPGAACASMPRRSHTSRTPARWSEVGVPAFDVDDDVRTALGEHRHVVLPEGHDHRVGNGLTRCGGVDVRHDRPVGVRRPDRDVART